MVIDNKSTSHFDQVQKLISKSDEMVVVSPFMSTDLLALLDRLALSSYVRKLTLVTVLRAYKQSLINGPILYNLSWYCAEKGIQLKVYVDECLHSKIYLFRKNGKASSAIITSANFTIKGLLSNHETGVLLSDKVQMEPLEKSILKGCRRVSEDELERVNTAATRFKEKHGSPAAEKEKFDPYKYLDEEKQQPQFYPNRTVYIKPVGDKDNHFTEDMRIGENLHFSKLRPHVQIGDILICYGVGTQYILGYFEVASAPMYDESNERWPWYVIGKNLSPRYHEQFWTTGLNLHGVVAEFNEQYPGEAVSATGHTNLNAVMHGKDKIRLAPSFAQYLMGLIDLIDHKTENINE